VSQQFQPRYRRLQARVPHTPLESSALFRMLRMIISEYTFIISRPVASTLFCACDVMLVWITTNTAQNNTFPTSIYTHIHWMVQEMVQEHFIKIHSLRNMPASIHTYHRLWCYIPPIQLSIWSVPQNHENHIRLS